jgi:subtilase family serine protease
VTQRVDAALRTTLKGKVHPMTRREFDRGEAPGDLALGRMVMILKRSPQQEAELERLLEAQQNIHSSDYHRWLTPEQFGARFGPVAEDVEAVTEWLKASGFEVSWTSKSRMFIEFSGSAAQVKQAFGAPMHSFAVNGKQHWANAGDPSIPTAAPAVAAAERPTREPRPELIPLR